MQDIINIINTKYNQLSIKEKEEIYTLFFSEHSQELKDKLEKIIYYKKPPTPEEFLSPEQKWLPASFIHSTYDWVKQSFLNILNPEKKYNQVVLYGATRIGKTYLALLLMIYTIVYIHHLREPALFYGLSPLTKLAMYIISFKYDKTKELYLDPLFNILQQSERFIQVKFQDQVIPKQKEVGVDKIVYSKAATTGEITLASGLQLQLGNDEALAFIGANILSAYVSEIAFWCEHEGVTEDTIFRLYTDLLDRIKATVGRDYLTFLYLDSSANDAESKIEKHILHNLQHKDGVYFKWQTRWDALPNNGKNFPIYHKTGKTFKVITGNGTIPPQIVTDEIQLKDIPKDLVIDVPIDVYDEFTVNIIKSIKDIAGIPTQRENKFISQGQKIEKIFDNETLVNITGSLIADSSQQPEELLFNQLINSILLPYNNNYTIVRAPNEKRYIGIDNAFSLKGDMMGFCMLHKEWSKEKNCIMYIVDCCFAIVGKDTGINLDAPIVFVYELLQKTNIPIHAVYADTFQSAGQKQISKRRKIEFINQSVDKTLSPYQFFLTCIMNETIKAGKNIFLKNNLQCLILTKNEKGHEKVDHPVAKQIIKYYDGNWNTSTAGLYAKDVSDAVCQALWGAYNDNSYIPSTIYEEENKRLQKDTVLNTNDTTILLKKLIGEQKPIITNKNTIMRYV